MSVEVGQRYIGWNKTWVVTRVWKREGVAKIIHTEDDQRTLRLPLSQFKTMKQVDDDEECPECGALGSDTHTLACSFRQQESPMVGPMNGWPSGWKW